MADRFFANFQGASELTGLSKRQLRTWDRTDILTPYIAEGDRKRRSSRLYSFRDLVALRVLGRLRGAVPRSELSKIQSWLNEHACAIWSDLRITVCDDIVYLSDPKSNAEMPRCGPTGITFTIDVAEVVDALQMDIERYKQRRPEDIGQITRKRGVMGYAWIVAGTRIPTSAIWSFHEAGYDAHGIIEQYPHLTPKDIEAAIEHERRMRRSAVSRSAEHATEFVGRRLSRFHHRALPAHSALLAGHTPPDELGFRSERLQIWYNHTDEPWHDSGPHLHEESDECFVVLRGSLVVEVEGERFTVGPREFCCFPRGIFHAVVAVHPPVETLMIRAPSVSDKRYQDQCP